MLGGVRLGHHHHDTIAVVGYPVLLGLCRLLSPAGSGFLLGRGFNVVVYSCGRSRFVENFPTPRSHRPLSGSFYSVAFLHDHT